MTETETRRGGRLALTIGLGALFGGLWLLLDAQGYGVPPFKRLWPVLLLLAGAASLADFLFFSKKAASAGWALIWVGFGVLGFALTLDYTNWRKILDWLPSFPTIVGLGLFTTWLVQKPRNGNLALAGGFLVGLGLIGYGTRFEWLEKLLPSAQVIWAVLLLGGGGYLVWRVVAGQRRKPGE